MTCKEIAEKYGLAYKDVTAAAKELGAELRRGQGHTYAAPPEMVKKIVAAVKAKRPAAAKAGE
jgi:hypothetical protein